MEKDTCIICLEKIRNRVLLPCGHSSCCLKCYITMIESYKNKKCPFCQKQISNDPIVITNNYFLKNNIQFQDEIKQIKARNYFYQKKYKFYYRGKAISKEIKMINTYHCNYCQYSTKDYHVYCLHLKNEHNCESCKICDASNKFLPYQICAYHKGSELHNHIKHHPHCPMCKFIGFDQLSLSDHLHNNHKRCDICANKGIIKWFKDENDYEHHCFENHFVCNHESCKSHGICVFSTLMELQIHKIQQHHDKNTNITNFFNFSYYNQENENNKSNCDDNDPNSNHSKRIHQARCRLRYLIGDNQKQANDTFKLIKDINQNKISVDTFILYYKQIFGERSNSLFCNIIATIENLSARKSIIQSFSS